MDDQGQVLKIDTREFGDTITGYVHLLSEQKIEGKLVKSVSHFKNYVFNNIHLRKELQKAIDQVPQFVASIDFCIGKRPGIMHGKSVEDLIQMLNIATQSPPSFLPSDYVGTPFSVFLIDIMNTPSGKAFFSRRQVNKFLRKMLDQYGALLKSEKSVKYFHGGKQGLMSQEILALVNYDDFDCDTTLPNFGFKSWNDWFTRNLKHGARPVARQDDPYIIVHAAENYPLTTLPIPAFNVQATDQFWLKQNRYSLYDMLAAEEHNLKGLIDEHFVGGTIYQGYLSPWCYHQWHSPVSGIVQRSYPIAGAYFMQNPNLDLEDPSNYDNSQVYLSCTATRHVFIIDTLNPLLGKVAVIEIGMVEVSSCVPTIKEGDFVTKGQCIGRFQLGGSSHVILFERKAKLEFSPTIQQRETVHGFIKSTRQLVNSFLAKVVQ